jgi:hypothetical protein
MGVYVKPSEASAVSFLRQSANPAAVYQPQLGSFWHVKQVEVSHTAQAPTTRNTSDAARFMTGEKELLFPLK